MNIEPQPELPARLVIDARLRQTEADAILHRDLADYETAVENAKQILRDAQAARDDARDRHPAYASLGAAIRDEESAKAQLLEEHAVHFAAGKTLTVDGWKVQLRESFASTVTDRVLVAKQLTDKGLFAAAVKDLVLDDKFARPLIEQGILEGAEARWKRSLAVTPPKEA